MGATADKLTGETGKNIVWDAAGDGGMGESAGWVNNEARRMGKL